MRIQIAMLAVVPAALATASAVQVLRARTDLRRGHRLFSLTLWGLLGFTALTAAGYGRWVLAAGPEDLRGFLSIRPAPAGTWIAVSGPVGRQAGFQPFFLFDVRSGRYFRIPAVWWAYGEWTGAFSEDGRRAVWLEPEGRKEVPVSVHRLDLDRPGARPVEVPILFDKARPRDLSISRDGRRVAAIHEGRILVMDLANGRNLASVPVPAGDWRDGLRFLGSGALRFYGIRGIGGGERWEQELRVIDIDSASGRVLRSLALPVQNEWVADVSHDGNHLLLRVRDPMFQYNIAATSKIRIVDLATGESSSPIVLPAGAEVDLLDDGRPLITESAGSKVILRLLDLRGAELRRFEIPAEWTTIGGEPAPGLLVVCVVPRGRPGGRESRQNLLLDLERGTWKPLIHGTVPVAWSHVPVGSLGTRLFLDNEGGLFELDPATGRRRVILHPEKR
jgi:hypothetical protein